MKKEFFNISSIIFLVAFTILASVLVVFNYTKPGTFVFIAVVFFFIWGRIILKSNHFDGSEVFDALNYNKELVEYNAILQSIIRETNVLIRIEKENGKVVFEDKVFSEIKLEHAKCYSEPVLLNNKYYKIIQKKLPDFSGVGDIDVTILQDITEFQTENSKSETFFAMLAHDIKTPIFAIQKTLRLVQQGNWGRINDVQNEIISLCVESAQFVSNLLQNTLQLYKLGQNNYKIEPKSFEICRVIFSIKEELSVFLAEKSLNIKLSIPNFCMVYGDSQQLRRVIINLIYNAINYSKPSSQIEIAAYCNDKTFVFEVRNEGAYIPPVSLKSIFNKDFSLDNPYSKPGTGLGLYLSKEIINAHGGEMIAKSLKNNINIFGFSLNISNANAVKR